MSDTEYSRFGPVVHDKMAALVIAHNAGLHAGSYRPAGCPGCLLASAEQTEGDKS